MASLKYLLSYFSSSGKKSKFLCYSKHFMRWCLPSLFCRKRLGKKLSSAFNYDDIEYIKKRVNYYNKLSVVTPLPSKAEKLSAHKLTKKKTIYFFDSYEYTRFFPKDLRWLHRFGDKTYVPESPTIVKSRPVGKANANSILLKLNKIRHFLFVKDPVPFEKKKDLVIFRGAVKKKSARLEFMKMYFGHPMCNLGAVGRKTIVPHNWKVPKITIREHLDYKFIMALEGNDVATNLKWIMSSNSLAVMPKPKNETWFMEETLIPNYHYVEIRDDFSDLEERLKYYIDHTNEAQKILDNANKYVSQFWNKNREDIISLLVLEKYFCLTGQSNPTDEESRLFFNDDG